MLLEFENLLRFCFSTTLLMLHQLVLDWGVLEGVWGYRLQVRLGFQLLQLFIDLLGWKLLWLFDFCYCRRMVSLLGGYCVIWWVDWLILLLLVLLHYFLFLRGGHAVIELQTLEVLEVDHLGTYLLLVFLFFGSRLLRFNYFCLRELLLLLFFLNCFNLLRKEIVFLVLFAFFSFDGWGNAS